MVRLILSFFVFVSTLSCFAQQIVSGPMPGYSTMREVGVWLQLDKAAQVQIEYWNQSNPEQKEKTDIISTNETTAFTAKFTLSNLEPGLTYEYRALANDKDLLEGTTLVFRTQKLWQHREDPPNFKVALGSCTYINEEPYDRPGKPYGGDYEIFEHMADQQPDMMLWLGDNIYLREVDWNTRSGHLHRYTHTRSTPEMQRLLQTTHHYATWDDHDFGPNDANGSWLHKDLALEAFELFWMNPTLGVPGIKGVTTAFQFNDMDFFLLDNRYHRTASDLVEGEKQILGKAQIDWLINNLKYSRAPFKFIAVGGQVLNTEAIYENHAVYAEERQDLIDRIVEERIEGVVFLTGDRHHTELGEFTSNGITIRDLTVSPLTSHAYSGEDENNETRVEGTLVNERNFGTLEFSGQRKNRSMKISIFDYSGGLNWTKTITSQ